jgi:diguanylate cyclase
MFGGAAAVVGTLIFVDHVRGSAVAVSQEATASDALRNEIVGWAITFSSPTTPTQQIQEAAGVVSIRADYAADLGKMRSPAARALLATSLVKWNALLSAGGPAGQPTDSAVRGGAAATQAPAVLSLLDQAGSANRAAIQLDLAHETRRDRQGLAALIIFELLAIALALRLSQQLSNEVLRPVGTLRDSANRLARGEFDHRVVVGGSHEFGELGSSFNAMADAIAGSQRELTAEANTDSLSGLANRAAFYTKLGAVLAEPNRRQGGQALLFIDLDDFKDVNDTLGHAAGDDLLRVVPTGCARSFGRPTWSPVLVATSLRCCSVPSTIRPTR